MTAKQADDPVSSSRTADDRPLYIDVHAHVFPDFYAENMKVAG